jgi:hypothetical protein
MASNVIREKISEYLAEVEAHLQAASPDERRETLRGLEEHLWEALRARGGEKPTMADLEAVLAQAAPPSSYGSARVRRTFPYRQVGWAAVAALGASVALPAFAILAAPLFGWNLPLAAIALGIAAPFLMAAVVLGIVSWREPQGKAAVIGSLLFALALSLLVPVTRQETGGSPTPVESRE